MNETYFTNIIYIKKSLEDIKNYFKLLKNENSRFSYRKHCHKEFTRDKDYILSIFDYYSLTRTYDSFIFLFNVIIQDIDNIYCHCNELKSIGYRNKINETCGLAICKQQVKDKKQGKDFYLDLKDRYIKENNLSKEDIICPVCKIRERSFHQSFTLTCSRECGSNLRFIEIAKLND